MEDGAGLIGDDDWSIHTKYGAVYTKDGSVHTEDGAVHVHKEDGVVCASDFAVAGIFRLTNINGTAAVEGTYQN